MTPPDLAEVLAAHVIWDELDDRDGPAMVRCRCDVDHPHMTNGVPDGGWMPRADHPSHQAQAWRDACTITTVDQLNAPELSAWGTLIAEIHYPDDGCADHCWVVPVVWEMVNQIGWMCHNYRREDEEPHLPCRLLWYPEWAR